MDQLSLITERLSFILMIGLFILATGGADSNGFSFTRPSDCLCSGHHLLFECTTVGPVATVWQGSAFLCENNNILLRHSQYVSPQGATGECNNGAIRAHSVGVQGNCFVSQLNVSLSSNLDGLSVQCAHNNGQESSIIGSHELILTKSYPPPNIVELMDVSPGHLTFRWIPASTNCPSIHYSIIVRNCGIMCPTTTAHNTITCTVAGEMFSDLPCTFSFAVKPVVCGSINGNTSIPVSITLKELMAPLIQCEPTYSAVTRNLTSITIFFEEVESFTIFGAIEGSAISYNITYNDSIYGSICGSAIIPSSSCLGRLCRHTFEVEHSLCSPYSGINVTVFGINQVGNGQVSIPITVGALNQHVVIKFDSLSSSLECLFIDQEITDKMCSIVYAPRAQGQCNVEMMQKSEVKAERSVTIHLQILPYSQGNEYCFEILATANNGTFTTRIEGLFNAGCDQRRLVDDPVSHSELAPNITCGASLHFLSIHNGIVCYNSTDNGASALYSCFDCISGTITGQSVRRCLPNGAWSGQVPKCDCGARLLNPLANVSSEGHNNSFQYNANYLGLILSISITSTLVLVAVTFIIAVIIIVFVRTKYKIQRDLIQKQQNAIYEEIDLMPSVIEYNKNIAYDTAPK